MIFHGLRCLPVFQSYLVGRFQQLPFLCFNPLYIAHLMHDFHGLRYLLIVSPRSITGQGQRWLEVACGCYCLTGEGSSLVFMN
jgi:hypothetical protein